MNIWRSVAGMLELELTSAELERTLGAINAKGIVLYDLQFLSPLSCRFLIHRKDYASLTSLCQKRGEKLCIRQRHGLYWSGKALRKRPYLLAGAAFLLFLAFFLPSRVLFVRVEGNTQIPERKILSAAENCGICFGASRREVRSEKMKNALLSALPELKWAGVNTYGCVAVISVREGAVKTGEKREKIVSSIVAARNGYILSGTATKGNALFQIGQAVKQGEILISGYTDCGICIRATQAEGEVFAQTNRDMEAVTPQQCLYRGKLQTVRRKISLRYRKKRINLWKDSGISDTTCGRMYEEYYVTLPGGFQLPFSLCVESFSVCELEQGEIPQGDAEIALAEFAQRYTVGQMVAGSIVQKQEKALCLDGLYCLKGSYVCTEMIGREQREQIGEGNGKSG